MGSLSMTACSIGGNGKGIVKKFGGFYFVLYEGSVIRCTYRGKHRLSKDVSVTM